MSSLISVQKVYVVIITAIRVNESVCGESSLHVILLIDRIRDNTVIHSTSENGSKVDQTRRILVHNVPFAFGSKNSIITLNLRNNQPLHQD